LKNHFFALPKVAWQWFAGEAAKFINYWYQVSIAYSISKIVKSFYFSSSYEENKK